MAYAVQRLWVGAGNRPAPKPVMKVQNTMAKKTAFATSGNEGTLSLYDGTEEVGVITFDLSQFPEDIVTRAAVYGIGKLGKDTYTSVVSETGGGTPAEGVQAINDRYAALMGGEWRERTEGIARDSIMVEAVANVMQSDKEAVQAKRAAARVDNGKGGTKDGPKWAAITKHPHVKAEADRLRALKSANVADAVEAPSFD